MRFFVVFVTAVCVLFLIKLRWPKKKNFYENKEHKEERKRDMQTRKILREMF